MNPVERIKEMMGKATDARPRVSERVLKDILKTAGLSQAIYTQRKMYSRHWLYLNLR